MITSDPQADDAGPAPVNLETSIPQLLRLDRMLRAAYIVLILPLALVLALQIGVLFTAPFNADALVGFVLIGGFTVAMMVAGAGRSRLARYALNAFYGMALVGTAMLLAQNLRMLNPADNTWFIVTVVLAAVSLLANILLGRLTAQLESTAWPAPLKLAVGRLRGRRNLMFELKRWQAAQTPPAWEPVPGSALRQNPKNADPHGDEAKA